VRGIAHETVLATMHNLGEHFAGYRKCTTDSGYRSGHIEAFPAGGDFGGDLAMATYFYTTKNEPNAPIGQLVSLVGGKVTIHFEQVCKTMAGKFCGSIGVCTQ
jgi:hypothetical protein